MAPWLRAATAARMPNVSLLTATKYTSLRAIGLIPAPPHGGPRRSQRRHTQDTLHLSTCSPHYAHASEEPATPAAAAAPAASPAAPPAAAPRGGVLGRLAAFVHKDRIQAPSSFNRWLLVPAAVASHICLGSVYAWSLLNKSLTREIGLAAAAPDDWALGDVVPVFATVGAVHGLSAAFVGKWQERVGPRHAALAGSVAFGGGFALGGVGVLLHNLPLLYLGFGVLAGTGIGLSYVPPVATLLRWFPDRRGMATGLTLMGFGGGALVSTPYMTWLIEKFRKAPEYLGDPSSLRLVKEGGRRFAEVGGELREVVVAKATDIAAFNMPGLQEGVYLTGTGSTGVGMTLCTLGLTYFAITATSALVYRLPPENHADVILADKAKNQDKDAVPAKANPMITTNSVHIDTVMRTPQFWQIWLAFGSVACTGMGVLSIASTMMSEIFSRSMPDVVTGAFASTFVMTLSAANLGGRVLWASCSDYVGRKVMFGLFTAGSVPLYLSLPYFATDVANTGNMASLLGFYGSSLLIMSFFGGAYSTTPAFEADMFGTKFVGAVHGRMLTASAAGAMVGPTLMTLLRDAAERKSIIDLASRVQPEVFEQAYGAAKSSLDELMASKDVTIQNLLLLCPPGTPDPVPHLYDNAMYAAAGLLSVAAISSLTMRPVNPKYHMSQPDANSDGEKEKPTPSH